MKHEVATMTKNERAAIMEHIDEHGEVDVDTVVEMIKAFDEVEDALLVVSETLLQVQGDKSRACHDRDEWKRKHDHLADYIDGGYNEGEMVMELRGDGQALLDALYASHRRDNTTAVGRAMARLGKTIRGEQ